MCITRISYIPRRCWGTERLADNNSYEVIESNVAADNYDGNYKSPGPRFRPIGSSRTRRQMPCLPGRVNLSECAGGDLGYINATCSHLSRARLEVKRTSNLQYDTHIVGNQLEPMHGDAWVLHADGRSRSSGGCHHVGARREPAYFRRSPITVAMITHEEKRNTDTSYATSNLVVGVALLGGGMK